MADFKALHDKWKAAKKDAKLVWDMLDKRTSDYTSAHKEMKFTVVRFPKFEKGLGPALDHLHDLEKKRKDVKEKDQASFKKDVKKYKDAAVAAIKQYVEDIKGLVNSHAGVKAPAVNEKKTNEAAVKEFVLVLNAVDRDVKKLAAVLVEIDNAVKTVKE